MEPNTRPQAWSLLLAPLALGAVFLALPSALDETSNRKSLSRSEAAQALVEIVGYYSEVDVSRDRILGSSRDADLRGLWISSLPDTAFLLSPEAGGNAWTLTPLTASVPLEVAGPAPSPVRVRVHWRSGTYEAAKGRVTLLSAGGQWALSRAHLSLLVGEGISAAIPLDRTTSPPLTTVHQDSGIALEVHRCPWLLGSYISTKTGGREGLDCLQAWVGKRLPAGLRSRLETWLWLGAGWQPLRACPERLHASRGEPGPRWCEVTGVEGYALDPPTEGRALLLPWDDPIRLGNITVQQLGPRWGHLTAGLSSDAQSPAAGRPSGQVVFYRKRLFRGTSVPIGSELDSVRLSPLTVSDGDLLRFGYGTARPELMVRSYERPGGRRPVVAFVHRPRSRQFTILPHALRSSVYHSGPVGRIPLCEAESKLQILAQPAAPSPVGSQGRLLQSTELQQLAGATSAVTDTLPTLRLPMPGPGSTTTLAELCLQPGERGLNVWLSWLGSGEGTWLHWNGEAAPVEDAVMMLPLREDGRAIEYHLGAGGFVLRIAPAMAPEAHRRAVKAGFVFLLVISLSWIGFLLIGSRDSRHRLPAQGVRVPIHGWFWASQAVLILLLIGLEYHSRIALHPRLLGNDYQLGAWVLPAIVSVWVVSLGVALTSSIGKPARSAWTRSALSGLIVCGAAVVGWRIAAGGFDASELPGAAARGQANAGMGPVGLLPVILLVSVLMLVAGLKTRALSSAIRDLGRLGQESPLIRYLALPKRFARGHPFFRRMALISIAALAVLVLGSFSVHVVLLMGLAAAATPYLRTQYSENRCTDRMKTLRIVLFNLGALGLVALLFLVLPLFGAGAFSDRVSLLIFSAGLVLMGCGLTRLLGKECLDPVRRFARWTRETVRAFLERLPYRMRRRWARRPSLRTVVGNEPSDQGGARRRAAPAELMGLWIWVMILGVFGAIWHQDLGSLAAFLPTLAGALLFLSFFLLRPEREMGDQEAATLLKSLGAMGLGLVFMTFGALDTLRRVATRISAGVLDRGRERVSLTDDLSYLGSGEWVARVRVLAAGGEEHLSWLSNMNSDVAAFGVRAYLGGFWFLLVGFLIMLISVQFMRFGRSLSPPSRWPEGSEAGGSSDFGLLLGFLLGALLLSQMAIHIATGVATSLPLTGIALPYLSRGGLTHVSVSSVFLVMALLAVAMFKPSGPQPGGRIHEGS